MRIVQEMFRTEGLEMPKICVMTYSVPLRTHMLAMGDFVTAIPKTVFQRNAERFDLKELPVQLPVREWPIAIVTLKNRAMSPVAELFLKRLRKHVAQTR